MGQEEEKKIRQQAFQGYRRWIDELMAAAKRGGDGNALSAGLPWTGDYREDLCQEHAAEIFEEAENRLHAREGGYGYADEIEIYRNA